MPCYHPLSAYQDGRRRVFFKLDGCDVYRTIQLPCGQCIGCRLERSRQWATRCVHESRMHEFSSFITLTYSDDFLPVDRSLRYRDFQLFMKRLRKLKSCERQRIRFYMCGEYGETYHRPHYHACLFGCFFPDREIWRTTDSGSVLYTSKQLEELWPYGFCSVGDVTFESAAYVARYVMKKVTGDLAHEHYKCVDSETGEVFWRVPEFTRMSLKPGIGATWYAKFAPEVRESDGVVIRGKRCRVPRYYDSIHSLVVPEDVDWIKIEREANALKHALNQTVDRMAVREKVARAALSFKKRSIE